MATRTSATDPAAVHRSLEEHSKIFRDLLLGFVKIHVLYHASMGPVYGVGLTEELEKHGYRLSPGTLYPLLHNLEGAQFLVRQDRVVGGKIRKYYGITPLGQRALDEARAKVIDLVQEVSDGDSSRKPSRSSTASASSRR